MKANELRIGNYITSKSYHGDYWQVTADDIAQIYDNQFGMPDQYIPLPLSSEWLERFGWGKSDEHEMGFNQHTVWSFYYDYHFRRLRIEMEGMTGDADTIVPMEYVHQLQNLYFALTGSELTLKGADQCYTMNDNNEYIINPERKKP